MLFVSPHPLLLLVIFLLLIYFPICPRRSPPTLRVLVLFFSFLPRLVLPAFHLPLPIRFSRFSTPLLPLFLHPVTQSSSSSSSPPPFPLLFYSSSSSSSYPPPLPPILLLSSSSLSFSSSSSAYASSSSSSSSSSASSSSSFSSSSSSSSPSPLPPILFFPFRFFLPSSFNSSRFLLPGHQVHSCEFVKR